MFQHVQPQAVVGSKGLVAPLAFIRFLTSVNALMRYQITFSRKAFITLTALAMLRLRVEVSKFQNFIGRPIDC